jgi:hypothetical protein
LTEEDHQAVRQLLFMISTQASAAGVMGLPIGGFLFVAQAIAGMVGDDDDPIDVEAEIKAFIYEHFTDAFNINDAISRGFLTAWLGLDLHSRLNQSDLFFREPDKALEGKYASEYLISQLGGPFIGMLQNWFNARKMINDGYMMRGVETAMPKVLKDSLAAIRLSEEGARSMRGDLIEDISIAEVIGKAFGVNSADLALKYDANFIKSKVESEYRKRRTHLIDISARAKLDNDNEAFKEAWAEVTHWNKVNPELGITMSQIIKSVKARKATSKKMESGFLVNPKLKVKTDKFSFSDEE